MARWKRLSFIAIVFLHSAIARPETDRVLQSRLDSLRGVSGVVVYIALNQNYASEADGDGNLNVEQLRTEVELRLRKAGIKVLPSNAHCGPSDAFLMVSLNIFHPKNLSLCATYVKIECFQMVALTRTMAGSPMAPFAAATWDESSLGTVGLDNVRQVRNTVDDLIDKFTNGYLQENPHSAP